MIKLNKTQLQDRINFVNNYINASNASTGSKFDANANIVSKNVATLSAEINKDIDIQICRHLIYEELIELYGEDIANKYIEQLDNHEIYSHDESHPFKPYCVSCDMYPFLENGLTDFGGEAKAPKHLCSYNGGYINLVFALASQFAGAVATPQFLTFFDYFAKKDFGENYLETHSKEVEQELQSSWYALNQPASARNYQSPFTNLAVFDENYFNSLFSNFIYPDGTKPKWESINKLQKFFMRWFNKERTKALLTFPVLNVSLLNNGKTVVDREYAEFIAQEISEGNSFFIYTSDTVDSLASCCFDKYTKVLWKSSTSGVQLTTLEELHNMKWLTNKKNLRIYHNGSWIKGRSIKLPNRKMFEVVTTNNKRMIMTDNHINVTYHGEKPTCELTTDDYLAFNTNPLMPIPENDEHLTYAQGFAVGAFLGDGSFGSSIKDTIYEINYSQNVNKFEDCIKYVNEANKDLGSSTECYLTSVYNNVYPIKISSKELVAFIQRWTNWKKGTTAVNKTLNLDCLQQSIEFRKGILDGWYNTDGGNSNRCYTTSVSLVEAMEVLINSLGMQSIIDVSDRTDEQLVIRNRSYNRNYPLYCVRWYEPCNKRSMGDIYKWKNNTQYFRVKSISVVEFYKDDVYCIECNNADEPYFTLPNGLITHNCRLRNSIADQINDFSYSLGAGGIQTGSISVITLNMNRFIQNVVNSEPYNEKKHLPIIKEELRKQIKLIHKYLLAFKSLFIKLQDKRMLPAYDAGYISLDKQYLTVGVNGFVEAAEYCGYIPNNNKEYKNFVSSLLETISLTNKETCKDIPGLKLNTEFVPGEGLGVKFAKWDKKDGYVVNRDCYNSYMYPVEDESISILDKFELHGNSTTQYLDGGSALHLNLESSPTKETVLKLLDVAVQTGCNYFCFNVKTTICDDCGNIDKRTLQECPKCGSKNIGYATRVIGYLRRVDNFSKDRQLEEGYRYYHKGEI